MSNNLAGINISQYIEDNTNSYIVLNYKVTDTFSDVEYQNMFQELKEEKFFVDCNYLDNKWYAMNSDGCRNTLNFNLGIKPEIEVKMKNYILIQTAIKRVAVGTACIQLHIIKEELIKTHFLDIDYIYTYINEIQKNSHIKYFKDFLAFGQFENGDKYFDALSKLETSNSHNPRPLPCYQSIIIFDYIIDDFIKNNNITKLIRYYPVLIWWKISSVIPLRPGEVYMLPKNCIYEKNGKYYIHIERKKNKYHRRKFNKPIVKEFEIKEEIYYIICNYLEYVNEFDDSEFLFSNNILNKCCGVSSGENIKRLTTHLMKTIYNHFLKEVVEQQYGYHIVPIGQRENDNDIEKIQMGDIRHLTIINMMMMGYNPLYIMELAGHRCLETQMGYYNHIETFATSKAHVLKNLIKKNKNLVSFKDYDISKSLVQRELMGISFYNLPLVSNGQGRCSNKEAPVGCVCEECIFCPYFLSEDNLSQEYLEKQQKKNNAELEMYKLELSKMMSGSIMDINSFDEIGEKISINLNRKILLDSYKLEKNEKGEKEYV